MGEPFAMIAESVIDHLQCGDCLRAYALLVRRQGTRSWAVRGIGGTAERLGWQHRTAAKHLRHLAAAGLVALEPEPAPFWGNVRVRVVHLPSIDRPSPCLAEVANVWGEPAARWRPPNRLAQLPNAERDAPSDRDESEETDRRDAPSDRQEARRAFPCGAPRLQELPNAERDALSVPVSTAVGVGSASAVALLVEEAPSCWWATCDEPADGERDAQGHRFCVLHEPF